MLVIQCFGVEWYGYSLEGGNDCGKMRSQEKVDRVVVQRIGGDYYDLGGQGGGGVQRNEVFEAGVSVCGLSV